MLIIMLVVLAAVVYVGRTFYKQFSGRGGCSAGCSCSLQNKQMCQMDHSTLNNIDFK